MFGKPISPVRKFPCVSVLWTYCYPVTSYQNTISTDVTIWFVTSCNRWHGNVNLTIFFCHWQAVAFWQLPVQPLMTTSSKWHFRPSDEAIVLIVVTTELEIKSMHYNDVIMGAMASQITSLTIVYSTVYSGADKNMKTPRHRPLCGEFTGDRWIPRTNGQLRGKCFHLITSSCSVYSIISNIKTYRKWPVKFIMPSSILAFNMESKFIVVVWKRTQINWGYTK